MLALALWPFVLTGVLLAWDRYVRLRRKPDAAPARAGPLLALTALAVVSHPTLDWLNNYGLRWLMPFDGRWFYGDALFVIDPWFWLHARRRRVPDVLEEPARARALGRVLRAGISADLGEHDAGSLDAAELVPCVCGRVGRGAAALVAARWRLRDAPPAVLERAAQAGSAPSRPSTSSRCSAASAAARSEVRAAAAARGIAAEDVMVAPRAGRSVPRRRRRHDARRVLRRALSTGSATPRVSLDGERVPRPRGPCSRRPREMPAAQRFLVWARYPAIEVEAAPGGGTLVQLLRHALSRRRIGSPGPIVRARRRERDRQRLACAHSSASLRGGMSSTRSVHCDLGPDVHARLEAPAGRPSSRTCPRSRLPNARCRRGRWCRS